MEGRRAYGALLVAIVGVSFASIFIRWSESPPLVKATYRMAFASLLLLPFVVYEVRRGRWSVRWRDLLPLAAVGGILAIHFAAWITSLDFTTVASSVILVNIHPIVIALLALLVLRERLPPISALAIVIGFFGILLIASADPAGAGSLFGNLLALVGGVAAALYILAGRRIRQRMSLIPYVFLVYSFSALFLLVWTLGVGTSLVPVGNAGQELLLFLALAVVSTLLGHTLYNWSLKYLDASVVSVSLLGEPVGAILLALLFLGEVPSSVVVFGGALVLAAIYLAARGVAVPGTGRPSG